MKTEKSEQESTDQYKELSNMLTDALVHPDWKNDESAETTMKNTPRLVSESIVSTVAPTENAVEDYHGIMESLERLDKIEPKDDFERW